MRASGYNIYIKFKESENWMLIHGYTGAIDLVQEKVVLFLKKGGKESSLNKFKIRYETMDLLKKRGYLTNLTIGEEREVVKRIAQKISKLNKRKSSYLFLVTYDCNFRCPYCYENKISGFGKTWSKKKLSKGLVDKSYKAMLQIQSDRNLHQNNITLYGGEPLMYNNYEIVSYIVNEGSKRGYVFNAITNGYDLNYYNELLKPGKIETVQITIDGAQEVHDKRRIHFQAKNTFYHILNNIERTLIKGVEVIVRVNTEESTINDLSKLSDVFIKRGWNKLPNFKVYSATTHGKNEAIDCRAVMSRKGKEISSCHIPSEDMYPIQIDVSNLKNTGIHEIFETSKDYSAGNISHFNISRVDYANKLYDIKDSNDHIMACNELAIKLKIKQLINNKKLAFRTEFCGAQTGMYIFDPNGDLYSCWEVVGMNEHKIGRYNKELEIDISELDKWQGRNITTVESCSICKYAFFCGGGCEAQALFKGKGPRSPYCDSFPKTFENVLSESYNGNLILFE